MDLKMFQKGFNYSHDRPGNRLVYHLKGCNMRCPWCSNPDGMNNSGNCLSVAVCDIIEEAVSAKPMFFENGGVNAGFDMRDTEHQGTKYNGSSCLIHGLSVTADSFAAIDKLLAERPEDADKKGGALLFAF